MAPLTTLKKGVFHNVLVPPGEDKRTLQSAVYICEEMNQQAAENDEENAEHAEGEG